jgi:hypothetical protein
MNSMSSGIFSTKVLRSQLRSIVHNGQRCSTSRSLLTQPSPRIRCLIFPLQSAPTVTRSLNVVYRSCQLQNRLTSTNKAIKPQDAPSTKSIPTPTAGSTANSTQSTEPAASISMWQRFLAPKPMPERYSASWYREMILICTVFAITGSSTMLVRILYLNM